MGDCPGNAELMASTFIDLGESIDATPEEVVMALEALMFSLATGVTETEDDAQQFLIDRCANVARLLAMYCRIKE